jgi:hypothetical protein
MIRKGLRGLVLIGSVGILATIGRAQVATGGFSVVLERNGNTWSLECAEGCPFKTASVTVEHPDTTMRLDNVGIRTAATPQPSDVRFSFTLTPRGNGWAAVAAKGTLWTALSVDCPSSPCRTTVTERGVGVGSSRQ